LTLYKISQKLSIEVDLDETNIFLLEKIVNEKKQELRIMETSFLWLWVNAKTDEEKNQIILQFVNQHIKK
jgi:Mg2+ and Co2+ transporter CorA